MQTDDRIGVLYLAPWVDYGGSDKGTIDLFRWLDRDRFRVSLITTQPSPNRKLADVARYADEVWPLPELMIGDAFPRFILEFIRSREIRVLHLMNSRLGFNLLPDLLNLRAPPAVVVQLHVEEEDRSGYVRYVTTRYGNLVDSFSVTSDHLAEAIQRDYEVPRAKCRVIHTGVDAEREFSPRYVAPVDGLEKGPLHILFAGRLVRQKDPLLMIAIASALKASGIDFQIHVLGEGDLEDAMHKELASRELQENILLYGAKPSIAPWLAASDLVLMTSLFEGVPYLVYEALAMGVPVVAPALPGVVELLPPDCGRVILGRGDIAGYVSALSELALDTAERQRVGLNARVYARQNFSVQAMADAHSDLYDELVQKRRFETNASPQKVSWPEPVRCTRRSARGNPLVSVIVPCFDHGLYLSQCLDSIRSQSYPAVETIVVDDGSTEPDTCRILEELEGAAGLTVIRLAANIGPGAARNVALGATSGRYILPVDADNMLLPDAIQHLLNQLRNAGERTGYIYPNLQFFGNRSDYFEAPEFNLYHLLQSNYCDTCSLIDRDVFEAGAKYLEEAEIGHEDWDFVLRLAEHEIYGEPARTKTLLFRKHGFTRSDVVEHGRHSFYARIRELHPALYEGVPAIKARWSPALSIVALGKIPHDGDVLNRLARQLEEQTVVDFEILFRSEVDLIRGGDAPSARRIPSALAMSAAEAAEQGLEAARGRFVLLTEGSGTSLLGDRTFVEKVLRLLEGQCNAKGLALADAGHKGRFPFRLLRPEDEPFNWRPHALAWSPTDNCPLRASETVSLEEPLRDLARAFGETLQWRHFDAPRGRVQASTLERATIRTRQHPPRTEPIAAERRARLEAAPVYSKEGPVSIRRLQGQPAWAPPMTVPLVRHHGPQDLRIISNRHTPPPGFAFEHSLGAVNLFPLRGTAELVAFVSDSGVDYGSFAESDDRPATTSLGYVELASFPLLEPLILALDPVTGGRVLVAGEDDPLFTAVEPIATLGWIEPIPIRPKRAPEEGFTPGLAGLVRVIDRAKRRHVYGIGEIPQGEVVGELGALERDPFPGGIAVFTQGQSVVTEGYALPTGRVRLLSALRWTLAPARWWGFSKRRARARAMVRRMYESARRLSAPIEPKGNDLLQGYLLPSPGRNTIPLYSSHHPVTFDQLLTTDAGQAADMGFVETALLGNLIAEAPLTGAIGAGRTSVPWASRFGEAIREA